MANKNQFIKEALIYLSEKNNYEIWSRLKKGDFVRKSMGLSYEIDDLGIADNLMNKERKLPYGPIHRALKSDRKKIYELFNRKNRRSFS